MADLQIKIISAGTQEAARDIDKLTKGLENTERATEKLGRSKNRLVDAFKKLKQEVPLAGVAIDTLKNPIAAVTIAASSAVAAVKNYVDAINDLAATESAADALGKVPITFYTNIAKAKAEAAAFREELASIQKQAETTQQYLKRVTDEAKRFFPENERAQAAALVTNLGNARRREQNAAAAALEELPAAEAAKLAAQNALAQESRRVGIQSKIASARSANLEGELKGVTGDLNDPDLGLNMFQSFALKLLPRKTARFLQPSRRKLEAKRDAIAGQLEAVSREEDQRQTTLVPLQERARLASERVSRLRSTANKAVAAAGQFGLEEQDAATSFDAGTAAGLPRVGPVLDPRVQSAYEGQVEALIRMFNAGQQRVDAVSRMADDAARAARAAAFANAHNSQQ